MLKKIIFISLLLVSILPAATVNTTKKVYTPVESITATYKDMSGDNTDWIAIYPAESSTAWKNVVQWKWIGGKINGQQAFQKLPVGDYEVRVFLKNSFNVAGKSTFKVVAHANEAKVNTNKAVYSAGDSVTATFKNMSGDNFDWIAIYPAGSSTAWKNVVQWKWIEGKENGQQIFQKLPAGDYEVRVFFSNSFNIAAKSNFKVEAKLKKTTVKTNKEVYSAGEPVTATFNDMSGANNDWIAIYVAGTSTEWGNVVQWKWIEGDINGQKIFSNLPAGDYEVRVFLKNSSHIEAQHSFKVKNDKPAPARVLYDDFEDGIDPHWVRTSGKDMKLLNIGAIDGLVGNTERQVEVKGQHSLRTYLNGGYYFDFNHADARLKFLEIDMKIGVSSHRFGFGVDIKTKHGNRNLSFACWLNHTLPNGKQIIRGPYKNVLPGHRGPFKPDATHFVYPSPTDFYVATTNIGNGSHMFVHYKIDLLKALKMIEPDNEILEIYDFTVNGGDYDNLALSSK